MLGLTRTLKLATSIVPDDSLLDTAIILCALCETHLLSLQLHYLKQTLYAFLIILRSVMISKFIDHDIKTRQTQLEMKFPEKLSLFELI